MTHELLRSALAIATLALGVTASAQEPIALPSDVAAVTIGGHWSSGSRAGIYRVVIQTGGWEHVVSQAQIDWIADPVDRDNDPQIISSKVLPTGSWRLDRPHLVRSAGKWQVVLEGTETHTTPPTRAKWIFQLGAPGEVKPIRAPR